MPNRYIRDDARTSKALAGLSDLAERVFWRLLLVADDFGRFEAAPDLVLAACFPRRPGHLSSPSIEAALTELETARVLRLYQSEDAEHYGVFLGLFQRYFGRRAKHSKYPSPSASVSTRTHVHADANCTHVQTYAPEQRVSSIEDRITRNDTLSRSDHVNDPLPDHLAAIATRVFAKLQPTPSTPTADTPTGQPDPQPEPEEVPP